VVTDLQQTKALTVSSRCKSKTANAASPSCASAASRGGFMKRQLFALLGLGLLLATSAYAQTVNAKANVPFNFVVTAGTLPSGEIYIALRRGNRPRNCDQR
jgi:hypothetical protein